MLDSADELLVAIVKKKQTQRLTSSEKFILDNRLRQKDDFSPTLIKELLKIDRHIFMENKPIINPFVFRLGSIIVHSYLDEEGTLDIKKELMKTMMYIKNSLLPGFHKVLTGNLFVGNKELANDMKGFLGRGNSFERLRNKSHAFYNNATNAVYLLVDFDNRKPKDRENDLIHEYAHKFHFNFMRMGYDNIDIIKLYEEMIRGEEHKKIPLPKIGDPLSNIINYTYDTENNINYEWEVKKASGNSFYLADIIYKRGGIKEFVYENEDQELRFTLEQLYSIIRQPSELGATNNEEFFAEMCTLITLNKVKDSQLYIANKFINIVKKNLK